MGKLIQNKISINLCSVYDCSSSNQEHAWYVDSFFILHFPIPLSKRKRGERVMLLDSILLSPFYQEKKKKKIWFALSFSLHLSSSYPYLSLYSMAPILLFMFICNLVMTRFLVLLYDDVFAYDIE